MRSQPTLLVFNLATDERDPVLGFATTWLHALAARTSHVDVITMRSGQFSGPPNVDVHSVGKERGVSEARRAVEFYRLLARLLRHRSYDACFAHMMPLFAVMGAPLLKARRIPVILWYAHKSTPVSVRAAEKTVDRILTPSPESFRIRSDKVVITGHGVDTRAFRARTRAPSEPVFVLSSIGRITPSKQPELIVDLAARLHRSEDDRAVSVRLVGEIDSRPGYASWLRVRIHEAGLTEVVRLVDPVPHARIADEYRRANLVVNVSETGSVDKAVLEAMSCGVPVVTSNRAFASMLEPFGLAVPSGSAEDLAVACERVRAMDPDEQRALGSSLREVVVREHDLDQLADRVIEHVRQLALRRRQCAG